MGRFFRSTTRYDLWLLGCIGLGLVGSPSSAFGQIVPDRTLPNNTLVTPKGNTSVIEQGTRVGGNLFHSFSSFSVPTGGVAVFNNGLDVQNIISRVSGGNISKIDGTIRAGGSANLFLINPNGIIFGRNAQLNIGGSFIGSTANSIKFADGSEFSATKPGAPPLLTINVPIGLQFGSNPASIINQSQATSSVPIATQDPRIPIPSNVGLQVLPGRTLALIGGDVILEGGNLTAFQGNILLGSVASPGVVSFIPTPTGLALGYQGIQNFGNIELSGTASVNASGPGGGTIQVTGGRVGLGDRSNLVADTLGNFDGRGIDIQAAQFRLADLAFVSAGTSGTGAGGGIAIRATDSVNLSGTGFDNFRRSYLDAAFDGKLNPLTRGSGLFAGTVGAGRAGNITIDTRQLTLRDGAVILSPTFNAGAGGDIAIHASELVEVIASGLLTTAIERGNAGSLNIDTGKLIVRDGAIVSTVTFGQGNGGDLIVKASDSVVLSQAREDSPLATSLSTSSIGGTGGAGNLEIHTGSLLVEGGAAINSASGLAARYLLIPSGGSGGNLTINASDSVQVIGTSATGRSRSIIVAATAGSANSGDLTINTRRLIIRDGAGVAASTVGAGNGGDIVVNASESVELSGKTRNDGVPGGIATASGEPLLQSLLQINPTGAAGNISVTTPRLIVRDGATLNVATGAGNAGSIKVVADAIALEGKGSIDATTGSGAGGNINLQVQNILLRRESRIKTDAGSSTGGNITINTDTLVAVPRENSDITANAKKGPGGSVSITAQGIFGTQFRDKQTPLSDITATSELGPQFNGTVKLDIRGIDPYRGLVKLPENVIDPSDRIATGCPVEKGNSFTITGRGGLPEDPTQTLTGRTIWRDLRYRTSSVGAGNADTPARRQIAFEQNPPFSRKQERIPQSQPLAQNQQLTTNNQRPAPFVEATGWVINGNGQVQLVANEPEVTPQFPWHTPANCTDIKR